MKSWQNTPRYEGLLPYREAYALQQSLHAARVAGTIPNTLILCEHPPVFTTGRQDASADWLKSKEEILSEGIEIVETDRGGRITYHGPGQVVGYFIYGVSGVPGFVRWIEEGVKQVLSDYGLNARLDADHPGVWVGEKKICAIGLHIRRQVSFHGFALNVTTDLKPYSYCIPCGIPKPITRLSDELPGRVWDSNAVARDLGDYFFSSMPAKVGSDPLPSSYTLNSSD